MKFACNQCGVHFPQDFPVTLKPPCNFWGDKGMSNMSEDLKKKLWNGIFALPLDEIAVKDKIATSLNFSGAPVIQGEQFETLFPGYSKMTEKEQQELQRRYFKTRVENPDLKITPAKKKEPDKNLN